MFAWAFVLGVLSPVGCMLLLHLYRSCGTATCTAAWVACTSCCCPRHVRRNAHRCCAHAAACCAASCAAWSYVAMGARLQQSARLHGYVGTAARHVRQGRGCMSCTGTPPETAAELVCLAYPDIVCLSGCGSWAACCDRRSHLLSLPPEARKRGIDQWRGLDAWRGRLDSLQSMAACSARGGRQLLVCSVAHRTV